MVGVATLMEVVMGMDAGVRNGGGKGGAGGGKWGKDGSRR